MTRQIGSLGWGACEKCIHYPPETGGCDVNITEDDLEMDYNFILCKRFEKKKKEADD